MAKMKKKFSGDALYRASLKAAYRKNPDYKMIASMLRRAIKKGNPQAMYALATWYLHGQEPYVKKDQKAAIPLLQRAATAGISEAMWDLAMCYEHGEGVRKNASRAFEMYLRSALHGDKQAHMEVGRLLFWGMGVRRDRKTAAVWIERAEELGAER